MYRALRGVCIGPERHVTPDSDPFPLDPGTATFLTNIGAVEKVPDEPVQTAAAPAAAGQAELLAAAPAAAVPPATAPHSPPPLHTKGAGKAPKKES
jgi:hypothetical protein